MLKQLSKRKSLKNKLNNCVPPVHNRDRRLHVLSMNARRKKQTKLLEFKKEESQKIFQVGIRGKPE